MEEFFSKLIGIDGNKAMLQQVFMWLDTAEIKQLLIKIGKMQVSCNYKALHY